MSRKLKNGIRYILKGVPEYKINVINSTFDNNDYLKNRIVLVTGGTKGIGYAIAKRIVESGGKVVITGRDESNLVKAQKGLGNRCFAFVFDVCDVSNIDNFLELITKKVGIIDSVVNNAGISLHEMDFMEVTEDTFDKQISVNLKGTYFMCQSFIKYCLKYKIHNANIINMVSETAGQFCYRPYGLTKVAVASLTKWLAQNYILNGIRVNAIAPGVTETSMTNYYTKGKKENEGAVGKRTFDPMEIAEVTCFLLSDASNCISGQIIGCTEGNVCFEN